MVEGKAEGKHESKYEIAKNLLEHGADIELVLTATGLKLKDIMKIQSK